MRLMTALCVLVLAVAASSCALERGHYAAPRDTVAALQTGLRENDRDRFVGALSQEVLAQWETVLLTFWSSAAERFRFLSDDAQVESIVDVIPQSGPGGENVPDGYIWPSEGKPAAAVTLRIRFEGREYVEKLLVLQETDAVSGNAAGSRFVFSGGKWWLREHHPNPARYAEAAASEEDRKSWRALYPYWPFQKDSALARRLLEVYEEKGSGK